MADIRLLLVDDHADTLEVLTVLLAERYSVVSCRSAAEALAALRVHVCAHHVDPGRDALT